VATEVEFVDEEEENEVSVVTVSASNKTGNTKSSLSMLTSKSSSSSHNNQTAGWPLSTVSAYILCPNKPGIASKIPYSQICTFCNYKKLLCAFQMTWWATYVMNCARAPVEVRCAIDKESKGKQVDENLMKMLANTATSYSMPMGESSSLESSEDMLMPPKKARIDYCH